MDITEIDDIEYCIQDINGHFLLEKDALYFSRNNYTREEDRLLLLGNHIVGEDYPIYGSSCDYENCRSAKFFKIKMKDHKQRICYCLILGEHFMGKKFSDTSPDATYIDFIKSKGWSCPYDMSTTTSSYYRLVHLYLCIRFREIKNGYKNLKIRYGKSLQKNNLDWIYKDDDKKLW
jgi:hypothetical protein